MFVLIIVCFTLATLYWAAWMAISAIQIRLMLVKNVGMELSKKLALTNASTAKLKLMELLTDRFTVS